jgi:glycosyltransferase involved in cell wall biosynthesis
LRGFTNAKILFICHNVVEHESKKVDKILTKMVLKKGDYFIVHSSEDATNLQNMLPYAKVKQSFHPTYEIFHSAALSKEEAKKRLEIDGNIILFFGFVRPYKGLKYLLEAMPRIVSEIEARLLIVGEFWNGEGEYRQEIERLGIAANVQIVNRYVPNEEVGVYFSAADIVVLPYISATGSGIVQAAFGCNRPVVSTDVGCLPEVIENGKTGYIVKPRDAQGIANAVICFYEEGKQSEFIKNTERAKEKFSWDTMVDTIESLCV